LTAKVSLTFNVAYSVPTRLPVASVPKVWSNLPTPSSNVSVHTVAKVLFELIRIATKGRITLSLYNEKARKLLDVPEASIIAVRDC
jgi:hypothetical protein